MGFEVDPRSVSIDSLLLKDGKDSTPIKEKKVGPGTKCNFPQEVEVAELRKGSKLKTREGHNKLHILL